jgi:hypothetical protein
MEYLKKLYEIKLELLSNINQANLNKLVELVSIEQKALKKFIIEIDAFDFVKYKNEYDLFRKYFTGLELYLRTAIYILYKYEYITNLNDRLLLDKEMNNSTEQATDLELLTDSFEPKELVMKWYYHFNPDRDNLESFVDDLLSKHIGCENVVFNSLYKKYVDSSWNRYTELWFADCKRSHK